MNKPLRFNRGFTLVEIMIVVGIISLLASLAMPAFQKVRATSQDRAVLNNMRQLGAAADQYFMEFGTDTVDLASLVGSSYYVKALNTVANESYPTELSQGITITVTNVGGIRTLTFAQ